MLDAITIQKLRDLPIEGVAERLGLSVKKHRSLCCFHDDHTPSLYFNVKTNTYRCFSCGAHGGVIDLALKLLPSMGRSGGVSFVEACHWLADENNMILTTYQSTKVRVEKTPTVDVRHLAMLVAQPYLCPEARRFLFEERHIKPRVVEQLGLSSISSPVPMSGNLHGAWFNAPSLLIPYRDVDGKLISVQARYLGNQSSSTKGEREGLPRFQFPKGSVCGIFNLPILKTLNPGSHIFVTEGVSDCLAMLSAKYPAIAVPSATLLKPSDAALLKNFHLHIYPDRDRPGEKLFLDLQAINPNTTRHQLPEGFKDVGQYYAFIHQND